MIKDIDPNLLEKLKSKHISREGIAEVLWHVVDEICPVRSWTCEWPDTDYAPGDDEREGGQRLFHARGRFDAEVQVQNAAQKDKLTNYELNEAIRSLKEDKG